MTTWVKVFTDLLLNAELMLYIICWDTPSEITGLWQLLPKLSSVFNLKAVDTIGNYSK